MLKAQNLNLSMSGGFDIATIHQNPLDPTQSGQPYTRISAYNFNLILTLKNRSIWGISVEPGFIKKGGQIYKSKTVLNYFQMPISGTLKIYRELNLVFGPEFSYMLSAKGINSNSTIDISGIFNKKFEMSVFGGMKYNFGKRIGIGIKYNQGLSYINKSPQYGKNFEIIRWLYDRNRYFQIQLCYLIF